MIDRGAKFGLATMCIGVGQGIATIFERVYLSGLVSGRIATAAARKKLRREPLRLLPSRRRSMVS